MTTIIICNVLLILCAAALGFLFAPDDYSRWFIALWAANAAFWPSLLGWGIFVAVHFARLYW